MPKLAQQRPPGCVDMDGGTENLSAQERELLTYLEDLQQNNPSEYELLVNQMQQVSRAALSDRRSSFASTAAAPPWDACAIAHLTVDRLPRLTKMLDMWQGPLAATIWLRSAGHPAGLH